MRRWCDPRNGLVSVADRSAVHPAVFDQRRRGEFQNSLGSFGRQLAEVRRCHAGEFPEPSIEVLGLRYGVLDEHYTTGGQAPRARWPTTTSRQSPFFERVKGDGLR